MLLNLNALKRAIGKSIDDHVAMHGSADVVLDRDLYWRIPDDQMFELSKTPCDLEIGNLVDELTEIESHLKEDEVLTSVSMQHLAALLTWLSAKAGSFQGES